MIKARSLIMTFEVSIIDGLKERVYVLDVDVVGMLKGAREVVWLDPETYREVPIDFNSPLVGEAHVILGSAKRDFEIRSSADKTWIEFYYSARG